MERFNWKNFWNDPDKYYLLYAFSLNLVIFYYFVQWPILAGDTDLWYHLNGGRYIVENKALPHNSFFSFISPPREWVDYYWLFQALVYKIYLFSGYHGLIFLRAFVYLATLSVIMYFLFKKDAPYTLTAGIAFVLALYSLLLLSRYQLIRPHMFSYLFMAGFISILEFRQKPLLYLLPLIAVLWVNFHGVEYPVMLLITLSYILEFFVEHVKKRAHIKNEELPFIIPATLSLAAVFLTPHGSDLIGIPFISTALASLYILELFHIKWDALVSFYVIKGSPSYLTIFNLLFITSSIAFIATALRRKLRLSHFMMFIGGIFMLTKANRFMYEFVLLALPVLRTYMASISLSLSDSSRKFVPPIVVFIAMIVLPYPYLRNTFGDPPKFPLSPRNLPQGISTFLNRVPVGGTVFNHPDRGGFLQWTLYPKYRIFMDLEVPFLFTDEDLYSATSAFSNEEVLRNVIARYDPAFIAAPIRITLFKEIIKKIPEYRLIFFDDSDVLYVNRKFYPDIALKYEITGIDPFTLMDRKVESLEKEDEAFLKSLLGIIEIYPDGGLTNQLAAAIYIRKGDYNKGLPHAEAFIRNYPELYLGYKLKGDSLKGLKSFDEAIAFYEMALKRSGDAESKAIYKEIGLIYIEQQQNKKAFNALKKAINITSPETTYKDLYYFGLSAFLSGKADVAETAFRYANQKVPSSDTEWKEKINKYLALFERKGGS